MPPILRFAPSPTGNIHIGNLRPALINFLFVKKAGGKFILRFDDTDQSRSKVEYIESISDDLQWLGLNWDQLAFQSAKTHRYAQVANQLRIAGFLYPCFETSDELITKRESLKRRGKPPVYDRSALKLTKLQIERYKIEGRKPHWRFKLSRNIVKWDDLIRGDQQIDTSSLSDPVLIRADGVCLYTLASVVDDVDMKVSHILRGEDHVTNTAVQLEIFDTLKTGRPVFGHHNLLVSKSGDALSKRLKSLSIRDMRELGFEPMSVLSLSATIGSSNQIKPYNSLEDIFTDFDIGNLSRSAARFDLDELAALNAKYLHQLDFEYVRVRFQELGVDEELAKNIWEATKSNLTVFSDVKNWIDIAQGNASPIVKDSDKQFISEALNLFPNGACDEFTWNKWTQLITEKTGRKGKDLFLTLRLALTGMPRGVDLKSFLPIIGAKNIRKYLAKML